MRLWLLRFGRIILLSVLLAVAPAWYYSQGWLSDYASRIDLPWWIFGLSGLSVMLSSTFVVGLLAMRAARQNPVLSLKNT
jgi:putative ABC transport system permease protein